MTLYEDYNNAKFILFMSTQYERDIEWDRLNYMDESSQRSNLQLFINSGANGYVIIPRKRMLPITNSQGKPDYIPDCDYSVKNFLDEENNNIMDECILKMKIFANKILAENSNANLWIGTPIIDSENFPVNLNDALDYVKIIMRFLVRTKEILDKPNMDEINIWEHVKGFYFNQEAIFTNKAVDVNRLTKEPETYVMAHICNYIHDYVPQIAPVVDYSADPEIMEWNNTPIEKDVIWVPYLAAKLGDNGQDLITKTYKNVATLVENTALFDCAFIQAYLIHKYDYDLNSQDEEEINKINAIKSNGPKNISAICHAVENGEFVYNDLKTVVIPQDGKLKKCIIGAEYEISGIHEFNQENGPDCDIDYKESAFLPYCKYDKFIGKKPLLFYWDGGTDYTKYKVSQVITTKYSGLQGTGLYKNINSNYRKFSDVLLDSNMQVYINSLENILADPKNGIASITVSDSQIRAEVADLYAYAMKTVFLMDNPDKYWIDDLAYAIEYDGDYASIINFAVLNKEQRSDDINPHVMKFLISLGIVNGDINAYSADYTDDVSKFIKIHDKLITDGTYIEATESATFNCAYGLLWQGIKKGTSRAFAAALSLLCNTAGIPCLMMEGLKDGKEHYWNYVLLGGEWWFADAALNVPTAEDSYKYKYFLRAKPSSYFDSVFLPEVDSAQGSLVKYGDVDGNGIISANDSAVAQQLAINSSFEVSPLGLIAADVDGNGRVTFNDASEILSKTLNDSFVFSVEEKINNQWI